MKSLNPFRGRLFQALLFLYTLNAAAQEKAIDSMRLNYPGPTNQDTSKYATIYIVRPEYDPLPDWWQLLSIDEFPMVKIQHNNRYVVQCARTGTVQISWGEGTEASLTMTIRPGEKIYLRVTCQKTKPQPTPKVEFLSGEIGRMAFDSLNVKPTYIYDPDPMEWQFNRKILESYTVHDPQKKAGFNEFIFDQPIFLRHYFASAEMGYMYLYANKMVSSSYSEAALIQRMGDKDFNSLDEFEKYVKSKVENADKSLLKKSETVIEFNYVDISTGADLSFASYIVTRDVKPMGVTLQKNQFLEVRTWQAYMYKKDVKKNKGRIFQVSFTERGVPEEIHTKEEIFFKMNLLLKSIQFGKVGE